MPQRKGRVLNTFTPEFTMPDQLSLPLLSLVGLSSVGKTAILQTLLRDSSIGEVSAASATTCNVNTYELILNDQKDRLFEIADTPGFQRLYKLRSLLPKTQEPAELSVSDICHSLPPGEDEMADSFRHDFLSWQTIARSHIVVAVIDATEDPDHPVPSSQLDMIPFLKWIQNEKPVVVLLNKLYPAAQSQPEKWKSFLQENGLRRVLTYDAHKRNPASDIEFLNLLEEIYPALRHPLERKKSLLLIEEENRCNNTLTEVARYLLELAQMREKLTETAGFSSRLGTDEAERRLVAKIVHKEKEFAARVAKIWGFPAEVVADAGEFPSHTRYSTRVDIPLAGRRVALGAMIGAIADVPFCGFSLGAGSILGALLGGAAGKVYDITAKTLYHSTEKSTFFVPETKFLERAVDRSLGLYKALAVRGHGTPVSIPVRLSDLPMVDVSLAMEVLQEKARKSWANLLFTLPARIWGRAEKFMFSDSVEPDVQKLKEVLRGFSDS